MNKGKTSNKSRRSKSRRSKTRRQRSIRSRRPRRQRSIKSRRSKTGRQRSIKSHRTRTRRQIFRSQIIKRNMRHKAPKNTSKYTIDTDSIFNLEDDNWDYYTVEKNTILFRGQKTDVNKNRPTYFALDPNTANIYLQPKKLSYLKIFKTSKDLKLFEINVSNINKILRQLFHVKTIVKKKNFKTLYEIIRHIFSGIYIFPEEKVPYVIKRINRSSGYEHDILFSNWLCMNGFDGYYASNLSQKFGGDFPGEVMICNPMIIAKEIKSIEMKQTKQILKLENLI